MAKFRRKVQDPEEGALASAEVGGAEVEAPEVVEEVPTEVISVPEEVVSAPVEVPAEVALPVDPAEVMSVNKLAFLKHVRRLLIGSTDRMTRNGTRRTVMELTGCTAVEADALVAECKKVKM